jgi:hypothetical protein
MSPRLETCRNASRAPYYGQNRIPLFGSVNAKVEVGWGAVVGILAHLKQANISSKK